MSTTRARRSSAGVAGARAGRVLDCPDVPTTPLRAGVWPRSSATGSAAGTRHALRNVFACVGADSSLAARIFLDEARDPYTFLLASESGRTTSPDRSSVDGKPAAR